MKRVLLLMTLLVSTLIFGCAAPEKKPMASNTAGITKQTPATQQAGSIRWDFYHND